jgi:hypothetical protein
MASEAFIARVLAAGVAVIALEGGARAGAVLTTVFTGARFTVKAGLEVGRVYTARRGGAAVVGAFVAVFTVQPGPFAFLLVVALVFFGAGVAIIAVGE